VNDQVRGRVRLVGQRRRDLHAERRNEGSERED